MSLSDGKSNSLDSILEYIQDRMKKDDLTWCDDYSFAKDTIREDFISFIFSNYVSEHVSLDETNIDIDTITVEFEKYYGLCKDLYKEEMAEKLNSTDFKDINKFESEELFKSLVAPRIGVESKLAITPRKFVQTIDKVSNVVFAGALENNLTHPVKVGTYKEKDVETLVTMNYVDLMQDENVVGLNKLNEFDRNVLNAVITLYVSGNTFITDNQIYRVLTMKADGKTSTKTMKKDICDSMDKMMYSKLSIDASEEMEKFYKNRLNGAKNIFSGHIISAIRCTSYFPNGTQADGYSVYNIILLAYASVKKQMISTEIKHLKTPIRKDKDSVQLQNRLLYEIEIRRKSPRMSKNILIDPFVAKLGIIDLKSPTQSQRNKKAKSIDRMLILLEYWRKPRSKEESSLEHTGLIKDYRVNTKHKRSIESITIIF